MINQTQYKEIVKKVLEEMQKIYDKVQRYKKLNSQVKNWGDPQYRAYDFIVQVEEEIKKINLQYAAYTREDLQVVYKDKDYSEVVEEMKKTLGEIKEKYQHFKELEDLPYIY